MTQHIAEIPLHQKILTRTELLYRGYSARAIARLVRDRTLIKLRQGLYCPAEAWESSLPSERHLACLAAVHRCLTDPIFSHTSAAALHGFPLLHPFPPVHIYTPFDARGPLAGVKKHPRVLDAVHPAITPLGFLATEPSLTVTDCARILPTREAVAIADSCLNKGLISTEELTFQISELRGRGSAHARKIIPLMSAKAESIGETLLRLLMFDYGLPLPVEQHEIMACGQFFRVDFAYPELRLIIEFDGHVKYLQYGDSSRALISERTREKMLTNEGWRVLRFEWQMVVDRPAEVARLIRVALGAAGKVQG